MHAQFNSRHRTATIYTSAILQACTGIFILSSLASVDAFQYTALYPAQSAGWEDSVSWCDKGLSGAFHKTILELAKTQISTKEADTLKQSYFSFISSLDPAVRRSYKYLSSGILPIPSQIVSRGNLLNPRNLYYRNNSEGWTLPRFSIPYGRSVLASSEKSKSSEPDPINTILAVGKVLPIFQDFLNLPDTKKVSIKLETFFAKACSLFTSESEIPSLSRKGNPFSCSLIDAVYSGIACSNQIVTTKYDCDNFMIKKFPDSLCYPMNNSLQAQEDAILPFNFDRPGPGFSLPITLSESNNGTLPAWISDSVRDSEQLTYLALYRALRIIYEFDSADCMDLSLEDVDLIPGWKTEMVISFPDVENRTLAAERTGEKPYKTDDRARRNLLKDLKAIITDPWSMQQILVDFYSSFVVPYLQEDQIKKARKSMITFLTETFFVPVTPVKPVKASTFPFLAISSNRKKPCHLAVGIRGTLTYLDWLQDFYTWTTPEGSHAGVNSISKTVAPLVEYFFQEHWAKHACKTQETMLTFYGHSLGGSVAQDLALASSTNLKSAAVLFAPLKHLSPALRDQFDQQVNGRVIIDVNDPLSYFPCKRMPRCSAGHMIGGGHGSDEFADHSALVLLDVDYSHKSQLRPTFTTALVNLVRSVVLPSSVERNLPTADEILAAHSCSQACALSHACAGSPRSEFRWWCDECPSSA